MNLFEQATREKWRFTSSQGLLVVEDLWDLPLSSVRAANLDDVAKRINRELASANEESFVDKKSPMSVTLAQKLELVKAIIARRQVENEEAKQKQANRQRKEKLLSILAKKQDAELHEMSAEDLEKMIDELD